LNSSVYSKLAWTNLKNNRKTYIPYILTAILTVMMFYIMDALFHSKDIGSENLKLMLQYSVGVIMIFAVILLFYTNSFLVKRRKKEIGVYNILGMGKRHIARMMIVETLITAVVSIGIGLLAGIVFGKLMYLLLLKILHYDIGMHFSVSGTAIGQTALLFMGIFLLTLFYNMMQIRLSNPIELLHGGNKGEKEPRTKWLLTVIGVLALAAGYGIALTVEKPMEAIFDFFVAVVCVIIGTYALFIAGSIAVLKLLKKNKRYYYKTNHFTAVSGMIYRMKQNAAGLANICILSTMVLVMVSTTMSLYAGMEDILKYRFPMEFSAKVASDSTETDQAAERAIREELEKVGIKEKSWIGCHGAWLAGIKVKDGFMLTEVEDFSAADVCNLSVIKLEDYNKLEGKAETLAPDELLIYAPYGTYGKDKVKLGNQNYKVKKELSSMKLEKKNKSSTVDGYYLVLPDEGHVQQALEEYNAGSAASASYAYKISFDMTGTDKEKKEAAEAVETRLAEEFSYSYCESRALSEENFYELYGSLLFMGIYLGAMFLMATVLIIYYKQISEGYDDRERYQIMQKVGMSRAEVKRSIRSQVLMVFFLPLVTAVIHNVVAFRIVKMLLQTLNLVNVPLYLGCTALTICIFVLFYAVVYAVTAREYYKIVNE
jgi:hypothetical protein